MDEIKTCPICGIKTKKLYSDGCLSCHKYIKQGGQFHDLPAIGEVKQDDRGYYICHICGMAYSKLAEHVRRKHKMTIEDYKLEFGLHKNQRLTADDYHDKMSKHNIDNNASSNFDDTRNINRFPKGHKARIGEELREQELIRLRKQSEDIAKRKLEVNYETNQSTKSTIR